MMLKCQRCKRYQQLGGFTCNEYAIIWCSVCRYDVTDKIESVAISFEGGENNGRTV